MSNENTQSPGQDPLVVGELNAEEQAVLQTLRDNMNSYLLEIGQLEVAKARILGAIQKGESRANEIMEQIAKRLDIPANSQWQVTPDKKVRVLPNANEV